jgi:hypothetical protein
VIDLHHEGDHVPALATAEAVEGAMRRPDVERRSLLVVERAQPLQRAATGPAQGDVFADHLVDPIAVAHLGDVTVPDASCHNTRV